jgi:hypothetical protein
MKNGGNLDKALVLYAISCRMDDLQRVLAKGAEVDTIDMDGRTGLIHASFRGHTEIVRLLLEHGADVHIQDSDGQTALSYAQSQGHTEIETLLTEALPLTRRPRYNIDAILQEPSYPKALGMLRVQLSKPRVVLTPIEERIFFAKKVAEDFYSSGLRYFFLDHDLRQVTAAIQGLEMIGAIKTLHLMRQALSIFDGGHLPDHATEVEECTEARGEFLDGLRDQYVEQDENVERLLYEFIRSHRQELGGRE